MTVGVDFTQVTASVGQSHDFEFLNPSQSFDSDSTQLPAIDRSRPDLGLWMDPAAKIKRKRDLMQLRNLKEKMRTVLFQIAAVERFNSDPHDSSVSLQSISL